MAYVIHITKKHDWGDKEPRITQEEWDALKTKGILQSARDQFYSDDHYAKEGDVFFFYFDGDITCKPPDDAYIEKIKEVAKNIPNTRVRGEDGEFY
jgi:hypothetical protein